MKKMTFEKAIKQYLQYVKLKDKQTSFRNISNRIETHILPYFKKKNIHKLTTKDYLNWQININKLNYKNSYKKTLHVCFVTFLNFCMKYYGLKENVASIVGNFKNTDIESKGSIWTIEEFNQFINSVDDIIYKTLFNLLFFTGLRQGEALALTFNDVRDKKITINKTSTRFFENNQRIITNPKTQKSNRIISIDDKLNSEIENLKVHYKDMYNDFNNDFFIFGAKKTIPPTTLARKKDYYCNLSNVKRIKIHEFRHSHACLLIKNSVPIYEISKRLGHANISMTTDIYLRYLPSDESKVLSTLNSI